MSLIKKRHGKKKEVFHRRAPTEKQYNYISLKSDIFISFVEKR